ncbi:DNA-binding transcriptional LysR family regulator [Pseudomonas sp. BIGb0450]|uniref:LysR family transcriptional regulator n=1 Tax=unclassified Pseudomonas TaxID=196821 RepID=UPI002166F911|nr:MULTISPECIES: LysR family transcriptional regulator [unclassified Pseudomonas]MCS3417686.1 DNA-binding transcriptional LysR family regulator [Pseudomonas sp. BIGb0558]MCS3436911.1 DNA-binding transcriptional LysR family regulator [Pseudomonas sp. BIGb0450]
MVQENRTIDFRELQAFISVVRAGGITAAAASLGVSKSTVSMQITRLEKRLGTRLLTRSSRQVALTREGEQLLPRIQSLLAETVHLLEEAGRTTAMPRGTVRVALTPALGGRVLEHLVPSLKKHYPEVRLVVVPTYEFNDLQDPAFDFAIRIGKIHDEDLVADRVGSFSRILVCASSHPAAQMRVIDSLSEAAILNFSGRSTHVDWRLEPIAGSAQPVTLDCEALFTVQDFDLLLRLVRLGQGVALVPDFMVRADIASGRLVHVLGQWRSLPMDVMLAYRAGTSRLGRVAAVLEQTRLALALVLSGEGAGA